MTVMSNNMYQPAVCSVSVILLLSSCFAQELNYVHVRSECRSNSIDHSCLTLNEMLPRIKSNSTVVLQQGVHIIERNFWVTNKTSLNFIGDPSNASSVVIECNGSFGLIFMNIRGITFNGLTVRNCGFEGVEQIKLIFSYIRSYIVLFHSIPSDFSTGIFMVNISDFKMEDVVIDQNKGFGVVGINIVGSSEFVDVNFTQNGPRECILGVTELEGTGGAMFLLYQDYRNATLINSSENSLLMENVLVENNTNCLTDRLIVQFNLLRRSSSLRNVYTNQFAGAGGVTIVLAQSDFIVHANITDSIFRNNTGFYHGSALEIAHFELTSDSHVFVTNTEFEHNGNFKGPIEDPFLFSPPAGALVAVFYLPIPQSYFSVELVTKIITQTESSIKVCNCSFRGNIANSGSGIQVVSFGQTIHSGIQDRMIIQDCLFEENIGEYGFAISATELGYSAFEPGLKLLLDSITTIKNQETNPSPASIFQSNRAGVIDITLVNVTLTGNNLFDSNVGTAISVKRGILNIAGTANFTNNTGPYGGGLSLYSSFIVLFGDKADLWFVSNHALVQGGGIYVDFKSLRAEYDCFLFFDSIDVLCNISETCTQPRGRFSLSFIENSASFGEAIFGSSLATCPWVNGSKAFEPFPLNVGADYSGVDNWTLPIFFDPPLTTSMGTRINSRAQYIVANQENSQYLGKNGTFRVFPGQEFHIPLGTLDKLQQPVPLTVFSQLDAEPGNRAFSTIGQSNQFLIAGKDNFTDIPFYVFAEQGTSYNMTITSDDSTINFNVRVFLENCPNGFEFDALSQTCVCNINLEQVMCNNNGTITHNTGYWAGMDEEGNFLLVPHFLKLYISEKTVLNLSDPDSQCRDNRAGVLCGGCREGYSRMIGTFACGNKCDSYWNLLFILLFAALGILLFAYLTVFNVTIKDGILNGFIFYANIIYIYLNYYLPLSSNVIVTVPGFFISILNLTFNIPLCFYPGMEEIHLALLRFAFPLYLMVLLLIVTLCGKYISNKLVSQFFQKINVTQVFATLILMLYLSYITTCLTNVSFISLENTAKPWRWTLDANVLYDDPLHIFIACTSIVLLIIFLPLPILLLFPRVVFRTSYLRNLKPVIDVFIGPLAPKREYWVGVRMLFRFVLFSVSALIGSFFNESDEIFHLVHTITISIFTAIEIKLQPFNTTIANFVNHFLLINLSLFSMSLILYAPANDERANIFMIFSLYVFLVMFLLLNIYYFYRFLLCFKSIQHLRKKVIEYCLQRLPAIFKKTKGKSEKDKTYVNNISNTDHTTTEFRLYENNTFGRLNTIPFREGLFDIENNQL